MLSTLEPLAQAMKKISSRFRIAPSSNDRTAQSGQVMVLVCLAVITIMGLIGLAADVGSFQQQKQLLQTAADSAALAAAQELNYGDSVAAAKADSARNGFTNGQNGVVITINN